MGFLKRLGNFFSNPTGTNDDREYWVAVKCNRCGEEIRGRIDLWNELSWTDPDSGSGSAYTCRKVLMGSGTCFQQIEIILEFDSKKNILDRQIMGGKFLDE